MKLALVWSMMVLPLLAFGPLVDVSWLYKHLGDKDLVVLDVSKPQDFYQEGHIPKSFHTSLKAWRKKASQAEGWHVVDAQAVAALFRTFGIFKNTKVVVYAHNSDPKGQLAATYILWAMEYYGFDNTALLEGGFEAWRDFNATVSTIVPKEHNQSDFLPQKEEMLIADLRYVAEHIGKSAMVDARAPSLYFGVEKDKGVEKRGHIPHAKSYYWRYALEGAYFKKEALLEEMLVKGLGFFSKRPIIAYSSDGLEASCNFFVLHRILGFEDVRLYDRSMQEWGNDSESFMTKYRWE